MSCLKELNLETLQEQFTSLCIDLNIDSDIQRTAWKLYLKTSQILLAEGDPMHWLCCTIYIAWQIKHDPTVGKKVYKQKRPDLIGVSPTKIPCGNIFHGNGDANQKDKLNSISIKRKAINLNHLLRSCDISMHSFINKVKYWNCYDLDTVQSEIVKIERKLCLHFLIFKYYKDIFLQVYQLPDCILSADLVDKSSKEIYNHQNLFDMGWLLYLCVKIETPDISLDLVALHNLLICCIELLNLNVLEDKRFELISAKFKDGMPKDLVIGSEHNRCVIEALCQLTPACAEEVYNMKQGVFNCAINKLLGKYTIHANRKTFLGLTSELTFRLNYRMLSKIYDGFMLNKCDFDERVLPNYALVTRKTTCTKSGETITEESMNQQKTKFPIYDNYSKTFFYKRRLQEVMNAKETLSADIIKHTPLCITEMVNKMRAQFCSGSVNQDNEKMRQYFNLAELLYYYFLDKILTGEKLHKPNLNLTTLFGQKVFISSLMTCCLELVLKANNKVTHKFPWILKCCNIEALNFYKILEIVVRYHDGLFTPSLIRHLRTIENMCLDSLVWCKTSMIWPLIKARDTYLPTYEEVNDNIASRHTQQTKYVKTDLAPSKSINLFLRKLYILAWNRLDNLCSCLKIKNFILQIWLIFQYSITHAPRLMTDRHLDQLIICSIYVYIQTYRIRNLQMPNIIKYYRFLYSGQFFNYQNTNKDDEVTTITYSDLIVFYNCNYLPMMTKYVLNQKVLERDITLTITPEDLHIAAHTKRASPKCHMYISPLIKVTIRDLYYNFRERKLQVFNALQNDYPCRSRPNILKRITNTTQQQNNKKVRRTLKY